MQNKLHILILSSLFFFLGMFSIAQAAPCHSLDSTKPVPANFGASYNLHSTDREILLTSNCNPPAVDISAGNGADTTYIWNRAHYWRNGAWEEIILNPAAGTAGDWIIGRGDGVINNISASDLDDINYYIAYICYWDDPVWRCGCRDAGCGTRYWQEQRFDGTVRCTDADADGHIVEADISGCGSAIGYSDCDDNNRYINYGAPEICSNFDPANNPVDDNCRNGANEAGCSTIITSLSPDRSSVSAGEDIIINYSLNTSLIPRLERVELWRSFDANNNQIADDGWTSVEDTTNIEASGSFTDNSSLAAGSYFYGLHAVDVVGNWATEGVYGPDKVIITNSLIVTITNPLDGANISEDISVIFEGTANGGNPDYTYSWSSSIDGFLGEGQTITIPK